MEISFTTKEESNKKRQEEFLKLVPAERFYRFLNLMMSVKRFPTKAKKENSNNFKIVIKSK
jgi:hypothetical protein